jgi:Arc/MetJ-type ribon-helix-helix transcriptional regulator
MISIKGVQSMNIMFPPLDNNYIKAKIRDGFYSNATELVRDAVRRLREFDDNTLETASSEI